MRAVEREYDGNVTGSRARSRTASPLPASRRFRGAGARPCANPCKIEELRARQPDNETFRRAAVFLLQAELTVRRAEARKALEAGGTGRACAETLSAEIDDLLRIALEMASRWLVPAAARDALPTIVAVGGYGRGMLAPFSDVDLLFLLPARRTPGVEKVVEAILYVLWDLKLKVGHATRSINECLRQARADMTVRTTLIEARLVVGDKPLFDTLLSRFDKEVVARTAPEFVAAKLAEREERVRRAGASRYLVEPNVKEGKGGLRDLNTLFWISKYVYRVKHAHELVAAGLFSPAEFALFRRCEEFLWSVRCRLHFLAGRAEERLSFDVQRADRAPARLFDADRPGRRRAIHEALFSRRQGRRRSHRDRLRGAGGRGRRSPLRSSTGSSAGCAAASARSPARRISRSTRIASTSCGPTCSKAIRSI